MRILLEWRTTPIGPRSSKPLRRDADARTRYSDTVKRDFVYLALRHQPGDGRSVVLRLAWPLERVNEAIARVLRPVGAVSLVALLLGGVFSLLFSRALSMRVQKLKEFSRRVAEGDFRPLKVADEGDELVELARALSETATRLDETIRTLKDERNQSAAILGSMSEGVVVVGPDERIIFCNQAFFDSLALSDSPSEGKTLIEVTRQSELPKLHPCDVVDRRGRTKRVRGGYAPARVIFK